MWVMRHVDELGRLWGVVMSGNCPWCFLEVYEPKDRHAHWLNMWSGQAYVDVVSAESLGVK